MYTAVLQLQHIDYISKFYFQMRTVSRRAGDLTLGQMNWMVGEEASRGLLDLSGAALLTERAGRGRQNLGMEEAVRKKEKCHQDVLSILSRAKD